MLEYEVKLVQSKIVNLNMNVDIEKNTTTNIVASFSASVYEPKEPNDPTAMVRAKCVLNDDANKMIHIECTAEMFFEITPTPENYAEVLNRYSHDLIQTDIMQKIANILHAMGHSLAIS